MPMIDADAGRIVTAAPGTGSTSLTTAFAALPGTRPVPGSDVLDDDGAQIVDAKHATVA